MPKLENFAEQLPGLTYVGAPRHVFKLTHVRVDNIAWSVTRRGKARVTGWVEFKQGTVYTYNEAVSASIYGEIPEEGRWFAIGELLYEVFSDDVLL